MLSTANETDKRKNGYKRHVRSRISPTDILIEMFRQAKNRSERKGRKQRCKRCNRDVLISDKIYYFCNGRWQNIRSIYKMFPNTLLIFIRLYFRSVS